MGQHTRKPSRQDRKPSPQDPKPPAQDRKPSAQDRARSDQGHKLTANKRRWTTVAVSAAVLAAASTTAWAAIGNDDSPARTTALSPKPASSPAPEPPAAAAQPDTIRSPQPGAPSPARPVDPSTTSSRSDETSRSDRTSRPAETPAKQTESKTETETETAKAEATKPRYRVLSSGRCGASYYGDPQMTASGERFNPAAMTAAHKTLPLGSKVRVTNPNNGESVTVRINDRGPYIGGRCLDLSRAAFAAIGNINAGVMRVKYEVLGR
ncbi:septal ring lytic transglycosylase RlpA family protein [Nonomuraea rubra]|uniref:septal ring lytic transglycosylase RlpA family protein n=1 Tax=Nonomuraea rubra TaxID=46180 RepID=UPI0033DA7E3D